MLIFQFQSLIKILEQYFDLRKEGSGSSFHDNIKKDLENSFAIV